MLKADNKTEKDYSTLKQLYRTGRYWQYYPNYHSEEAPWKFRKMIGTIPPTVSEQLPQAIKIVDIGCGTGQILKLFSNYFDEKRIIVKAIGYDISKQAVELAQKSFPGASFIQDEFSKGNFAAGEIDFALMIDLLEHLAEPEDLLKGVSSVCKYAICHLPLDDNLNINLRHPKEKMAGISGHINFYNLHSAEALFAQNGFVIENKTINCLDYDGDHVIINSFYRKYLGQPLRKLLFGRFPRFVVEILGACSVMFFLRSIHYRENAT